MSERACEEETIQTKATSLSLKNLTGAFCILLAGIGLGLLSFVVENVLKKKTMKKVMRIQVIPVDQRDSHGTQSNLDRDQMDCQKDEMDGTGDQMDGTRDQMDGTGDQMDGTGDQMDGTGDQMDGTRDQMDGTRDKMDGTGDQMDGTRDQVNGTGDKMNGTSMDQRKIDCRNSQTKLEKYGKQHNSSAWKLHNCVINDELSDIENIELN